MLIVAHNGCYTFVSVLNFFDKWVKSSGLKDSGKNIKIYNDN